MHLICHCVKNELAKEMYSLLDFGLYFNVVYSFYCFGIFQLFFILILTEMRINFDGIQNKSSLHRDTRFKNLAQFLPGEDGPVAFMINDSSPNFCINLEASNSPFIHA